MRWLIFVLIAGWLQTAAAMPTIMGVVRICVNKPGSNLRLPPSAWIEKERRTLEADDLRISVQGFPFIYLRKRPRRVATSIVSRVDLTTWFKNRECARSWESFYACMNEKKNPADEKFYRNLDLNFYSKIICQNDCIDKDFLKWQVKWPSPAIFSVEASIGKTGGFVSLEAARKSLERINTILGRVANGARFPENYNDVKSENESFVIEETSVLNFDFRHKISVLLNDLKSAGYLTGLDENDTRTISKLIGNSNVVFFVPAYCSSKLKPGWNRESNNVRLRLDEDRCPEIQFLR